MKAIILTLALTFTLLSSPFGGAKAAAQLPITGSGASFPFQIYSIWLLLFNRDNPDIKVSYIPKGSGSGIRDFQAHKVDFAASDAAMNPKEIAEVNEGVQLLPMTAGEVVIAYNLPEVKSLKLPRLVYPDIFLGKITKWNDPAIQAANPEVQLPDLDITVVTRADSSGTTFVFSKHLSAISKDFRDGPGFGKKIDWPAQNIQKSRINAGVASTIKTTPGAIGYIDFGFASMINMAMAHLENKAGNYIAPGLEGGQAALTEAEIPDNMIVWLPDPAGRKSYPITTYTWLIFYKKYDDPQKAEVLRKMVSYFLEEGQKLSLKFGYIPLPENVITKVQKASMNIGSL